MNRTTFLGLACTLIFSLAPLTIHAQEKTQDQIKKGTIKFFNSTKGFGFISNVPGMDELLANIAAICGGPATGCTFEIMDILNEVLYGTHGGSDSTDGWSDTFRGSDGTRGLIDEINEGDKVEFEVKEGPKGLNAVNVKID